MAELSGEWTPGPWSVEIDDQSGIGRTHAVYICDTRGWPEGQIARVNVQDALGQREANARLIAAAPELAEALAEILGDKCPECKGWGEVAYFGEMVSCRCHGKYRYVPTDGQIAKARAALSKAQGGAK